ncbi:MAG: Fe-S cluster assembly protein SufD [Ignavibacteriales bacterium]|nr:Fe-S cluster assembly protein SufD [Ignavibacteriales bacterium]
MIQTTEQKNNWYQSNFEMFEKKLNGESNASVHTLRRNAIARFNEMGFPTNKHEEWRFTNINPIVKANFTPSLNYTANQVTLKDIEPFVFNNTLRLVFVNGHFSKELSLNTSLPNGVIVESLATALKNSPDLVGKHLAKYSKYDENAFTALNAAFLQDGAFIYIPDGIALEQPVHLLYISTGSQETLVSHPRNLIITGKNAQLSLVESYVCLGENSYLTNAVTEIVLGESAIVEHDKLQIESELAYHVGTVHVYQNGKSNYMSNSISLGGSIARNNITAVLDAEGSECTLNGLSLATHQQLVDNHTTIDHSKPHCNSHELYKSILDGKSKGVFNGKIFVRKDAQKTDAKQTNKTLLLSDDATIDTKPQLEIFADDVKCTHGATVGQLDAEQIFYLRSRGIELTTARDILTFAFASDVVSRVHIEPLKEQLEAIIHARLDVGRQSRDIR